MADNDKVAVTDEELELERQRELEEEEKNSDVEEEDEESEEKGQGEEEAPAEKPKEEAEEEPAEEPAPDGADEDAQPRQTRKERRAERAKRFSELRNESRQRDLQRQQVTQPPNYKPIDYNALGEEVNLDELAQDRDRFGNVQLAQGMQIERFYAEQERFNDKLEVDNDYILSKPEFSFLDETSDNFDADLADDFNDLYLSMAGYDENSKTFQNTGIRYKQFAPKLKGMMDKYAATRYQNSEGNVSKRRSNTGVRPTAGASRGGTRVFTPEQIARMSDEQYKKYEKDIERQINSLI